MTGARVPGALVPSPSKGPYLAVTTGALGIAWAPIFVALSGASPVAVTFWRYAYALPVLAGLVAFRPRARATFRVPGWKGLALIAGVCLRSILFYGIARSVSSELDQRRCSPTR